MKQFNQLIELLPPRSRKQGILILIMIILMALIDVIGVGSIMPFIGVISNPDIIQENDFLYSIYNNLDFKDINQFTIFLGITFMGLFLFSIIFKSLTVTLQLRFIISHEYIFGKKLIEGYFNQPYIWFLNQNSSDIGKNILYEVGEVIGNGLMPLMNIISQSVVSLALVGLVLVVNPLIGFKVIFLLLFSYLIIFLFVNRFLIRIGKYRLSANKDRFRIVNEAFGAIKDLKVLDTSENYVSRFSKVSSNYWRYHASSQIIAQLPRFALEAISFGSMLLIVLTEYAKGTDFNSNLPILSVYAISGYRLLPSFQQIYVSFSKLRYVEPILDLLYSEINSLKYPRKLRYKKNKIVINKSIKLKNIYFSYPEKNSYALENISLEILKNQKIGLTGVSGSGKSTLVDIVLGLLSPEKGQIYIDDKELNNLDKRDWINSIGYVSQSIYLSDDSILSNIAFGLKKDQIDFEAVRNAAKLANIDQFIEKELSDSYKTIIGERGIKISGGQKQRIGLARALYRNPSLLILDEGTSALDNITEKLVMESINKLSEKITIILIAHRLKTLKNCDNVFVLDKSKVVAEGTYEKLLVESKEFFKLHN